MLPYLQAIGSFATIPVHLVAARLDLPSRISMLAHFLINSSIRPCGKPVSGPHLIFYSFVLSFSFQNHLKVRGMQPLYLLLAAVAAFALPQDSTSANGSLDSAADSTSTKLHNVNYGAFTQTATYSVANKLGFFKAYGLNITYLQVPNSTYGYNQLLNGGYNIMTGTIDNAVNLRFNQQQPLTVTGQLDGGPELTIASIPSITSIAQLKGKPLMVDSAVSGYAYILRKVLALHGLYLENGDYTFQVRVHAH